MNKHRKIWLSALSVLVVAALLAGATYAWFTDNEQAAAGFEAGVLNIDLAIPARWNLKTFAR